MILKIYLYTILMFAGYNKEITPTETQPQSKKTSYYFSINGDDKNDGSELHPLKTIQYLNSITLNAGDSVLFKGGDSFNGNIILQTNGAAEKPVLLTSYGNGNAIINAGNGTAITLTQSSYISIKNISCKGSGRKDGNTTNGVSVTQSSHVTVMNTDISGFQKAGLLIYNSFNIGVENISAHDNGFAGISVSGQTKKDDCVNIHISNCSAENNPGDPTNFNNHSGNGILVGYCKNVMIEYCTATNNGWDMPRIGNGPVGIWCYEADSVIIQHCIAYKNKTSKGGEDGGGYDLDGGTTNSVIQYCLSYENQGSAFGIFQYAGASEWHDNVIRFCISENDGKVSAAHAGAYIWNSSRDTTQFKNFLFYNNTIYNDSDAAISYSVESAHSNFKFYNNILIGADEIIKGNYADDIFLANDWWSLKKEFNVSGNYNFENWCTANNKEQLNGVIKGLNIMPPFKSAGNTTLTNANQLTNFNSYKIVSASPVTQAGLDLHALFHIDTSNEDFNGLPVAKNYIGACNR